MTVLFVMPVLVAGAMLVSVVLLLSGCYREERRLANSLGYELRDARKLDSTMDEAAAMLEEFGTVSVSSPLLTPAQSAAETFNFDLKDIGPAEYYRDARNQVQGISARFDRSARATGVRAEADVDVDAHLARLAELQAFDADSAAYNQRRQLEQAAASARLRAALAAIPAEATPAERAAAEAAAMGEYAATAGPETRPSYPDPPEGNGERAPFGPDQITADDMLKDLTGLRGLIPDQLSPTLANRAALNIAAGDTATEAIFSLLSDPHQFSFKDKKLLFGVAMVSVAPGWKTKSGYAADISLQVSYGYEPARLELLTEYLKRAEPGSEIAELLKRATDSADAATRPADPLPSLPSMLPQLAGVDTALVGPVGLTPPSASPAASPAFSVPTRYWLPAVPRSPLVAAVSPMTDAEVLDLSASVRRQRAQALALALALRHGGLTGQADVFDQYAERLEDDTWTRGAANAVTSYSHSGGLFGFQIGPRLRADHGGASRRRSSDMVLERQSFPVLVIIGMDADDIGLRFAERNGRLEAFEPVLRFEQGFRWLGPKGKLYQDFMDKPTGVYESRILHAANDLLQVHRALPPTQQQLLDRLGALQLARQIVTRLRVALPSNPDTGTVREHAQMAAHLRHWLQPLLLSGSAMMKGDEQPDVGTPSDLRHAYEQLDETAKPDLKGDILALQTYEDSLAAWTSGGTIPAAPALANVDKLFEEAVDGLAQEKYADRYLVDTIRRRLNMLLVQAVGSSNQQAIPMELILPPEKPKAEVPRPALEPLAAPVVAPLAGAMSLVLRGRHLIDEAGAHQVSAVLLTGNLAVPVTAHVQNATAISVTFDTTNQNVAPGTQADLVAVLPDGPATVGRVVFGSPPAPVGAASPGVRLARDEHGRIVGVQGNGVDILEFLRILLGGKDGSELELNVDGSAGFDYSVRSRSSAADGPSSRPSRGTEQTGTPPPAE